MLWGHLAASSDHGGSPIGNLCPYRRMNANQQRWSPRDAHLMPKVRTAVMNGTFAKDHVAAEWRAKRPYRRAA